MQAFAAANTVPGVMTSVQAMIQVATDSSLAVQAAYTIRGQIYSNCYQEYLQYIEGEDNLKFYTFVMKAKMAGASFPLAQISFKNLGNYAKDVYSVMNKTIVPSFGSVFDNYLDGTITKMDLVSVFDTPLLRRALQDLR